MIKVPTAQLKKKSLQPTSASSYFTNNHVVIVFYLYMCSARHTGVKAADGAKNANAFKFFIGIIIRRD